jgi:hypothetical protein
VNPPAVKADVAITTPAGTNKLPQGDTLKHNLTISGADLIVKHCLEFLVGTEAGGNHDVIMRTVPNVTGIVATAGKTFSIELPNFRHQSPNVRLSHELLLSISDKEWALASASADFDADI